MGEQTRNLTCELIGTFALTFIGAGAILVGEYTGNPSLVAVALAHGIVLALVVSATMNISGGHINPAVTVAMMVTRRISPKNGLLYIIAQCVGATVAGLFLSFVYESLGDAGQAAITATMLGTPNLAAGVSVGTGVAVEIALTFLLLFAVFGTAVDARAPKIGGFGIGLMVGVDILAGGPITGAAMNPARTIGTLIGGGSATTSLWAQHWVYWVGPIVGGVLAALVYDKLIMDSSDEATS